MLPILLWALALLQNQTAAPLALQLEPATAERLQGLEPGLGFRVYESHLAIDHLIAPNQDQSPNLDELRERLMCTTAADFGGFERHYVAVASALLRIESPGSFGFRLTSDDGSLLKLGGRTVILNDGEHAPLAKEALLDLEPGLYPLEVLMFQNEGGAHLTLEWQPPEAPDYGPLQAPHVMTERGVTRVVAPGPKQFTEAVAGRRPGAGLALDGSHPGWRVEGLRPSSFEPKVGALGWLPDGRLGVATFDPKNNGQQLEAPNGTLWALSDWQAEDPEAVQVEAVAEGLYHPLGLLSVGEWVYVAERDDILRLKDADGDGRYETREVFARGWVSDNYHHFTFGLKRQGDHLLATLSTSIGPTAGLTGGRMRGINGPNPPDRGTLMHIALDENLSPEERVSYVCGGFRTPNGLLPLPDGSALVADNQGAWKPASRIDQALPGHFYGHYNETRALNAQYPKGGQPALFSEQPESPPAIWLPQGEVSNSPSEMLAIESGPFAGQILFGELKLGGIRRAFLEEVEGQLQGGALRFCQGFEGGVNRLLWAPDGSLIVGMTGESASWSWRGTTFGLQRLVPTGGGAFEIHSVRATATGFRLCFTERVETAELEQLDRYRIASWRYLPSPEYGGPKLDEQEHAITALRAGDDGYQVEIDVAGLSEGRCVYLSADLTSARGETIWSPECWYTLNRIPGRALESLPAPETRGLLIFSRTEGFRHASIEDGVRCLEALCQELGLAAVASEDPTLFDDRSLARFRAVVFLSTTGDVLDLRQEAAFERFIRAGGGFLGIHAAADSEYDWPFYGQLVGAYFQAHPAIQAARVSILDRAHPATQPLPKDWRRTDEWYDFRALPSAGERILLTLDEQSYTGGSTAQRFGSHPIAWCRELGPARTLYTGGGHTSEAFQEPLFRAHLKGALAWVCRLAD